MQFVWDIAPSFTIGPLSLRWYSVVWGAQSVVAYLALVWQVRRAGGTDSDASWLMGVSVAAVILGGRFGHMLFYDTARLLADPWVFLQRESGLSSHGATVAVLLTMYAFARIRRVPYLEVGDRAMVSFSLGAAGVRVANFVGSEIVGRVTNQTWGVRFPYYDRIGEVPLRHPSQLYEVLLGLLVCLALVLVDRRLPDRPRGLMVGLFFTLYFSGRFLVEFFKEYQTLPTDSLLTMGQMLSIPGVVGGVTLTLWAWRKKLPSGWNVER